MDSGACGALSLVIYTAQPGDGVEVNEKAYRFSVQIGAKRLRIGTNPRLTA